MVALRDPLLPGFSRPFQIELGGGRKEGNTQVFHYKLFPVYIMRTRSKAWKTNNSADIKKIDFLLSLIGCYIKSPDREKYAPD